MISKKIFNGDGTTTRYLSDFIIRNEQYARPYVYIYDDTLNPDSSEDTLVDGTTVQANWSWPDNIWKRGADVARTDDLVPVDKWQVVDSSISYYIPPITSSRVWLEVATTSEEFGTTLGDSSVERAEEAADEAAASAAEAAISAEIFVKWIETPTVAAGQTVFNATRDLASVTVYVNGILQRKDEDYTTLGTQLTLEVETEDSNDTVTLIGNEVLSVPEPSESLFYVDTLADLSSVNPELQPQVGVTDVDRGGIFIYDASLLATDNDGTIIQGWVRQYSGPADVKWFGVLDDGIDYSTKMNAAVQSVDDLHFSDGTYKFNSTIVLKENSSITASPNAIRDFSGVVSDYAGFRATGNISAEQAIEADLTSGDTVINVTGHGYVVGDWLLLKSARTCGTDDCLLSWRLGDKTASVDSPYFAEVVRVESVTADTITMFSGLMFPEYPAVGTLTYDRANTTVAKLNFINNITIKGGTIIASTIKNGFHCIRLEYTKDAVVKDAVAQLGYSTTSAVYLLNSLSTLVRDCRAERPADWTIVSDHSGYNSWKDIGTWMSTWDVEDIHGCQGYDQSYQSGGHCVLFPDVTIRSIEAKEEALTTHGNCYMGKYDVTAMSPNNRAMSNRGRFTDIKVNVTGDGNAAIGGLVLYQLGAHDCNIHDSQINNCGYGIDIISDLYIGNVPSITNLNINNCAFRNTVGSTINFRDKANNSLRPSMIRISNCMFDNDAVGINIGKGWNAVGFHNIKIHNFNTTSARQFFYFGNNLTAGHHVSNVETYDLDANAHGNELIKNVSVSDAALLEQFKKSVTVSGNINLAGGATTTGKLGDIVAQYYENTLAFTLSGKYFDGSTIQLSSTAPIAVVITVDMNDEIPRGKSIPFIQYNTGAITFSAGAGITIHSPDGLSTSGQGAMCYLTRIGTSLWTVSGSMIV